jgi:hypothetical protein
MWWTSYTVLWIPLIKEKEKEETVYVNLSNVEAVHKREGDNTISIYTTSGQLYKSYETLEEFFERIGKGH